MAATRKAAMPVSESSSVRPLSNISMQEIGAPSIQELHSNSHHIELLDRQTLTGSGMALNELQNRREFSPSSLLAPAPQNRNTSPSLERTTSSANTSSSMDRLSIESRNHATSYTSSSPSLLLYRPTPPEKDTMGILTRAGEVTKHISHLKIPPQAVLAKSPSAQTHPADQTHLATSDFEDINTVAGTLVIARNLPVQRTDPTDADMRASPTYATVFNIEAYKDGA